MRKSISFYLLPVLLTVLCLSSCSETGQKTEYTHVIPANATEVAALDLKSIVDKAGLNTSDSRATLQKFLGLLLEGGSANLKQEAETLLKDPAESGIDWNAPLYVFEDAAQHGNHPENCRFKEVRSHAPAACPGTVVHRPGRGRRLPER